MVTATEMLGLEDYIAGSRPPAIAEGATSPETWTGSAAAWAALATEARAAHRAAAVLGYVRLIGAGARPDEIARGQLDRGAGMTTGGQVVRPEAPTIPAELEAEARQLLHGLHVLNLVIDGTLSLALERAAYRRWLGPAGPVEAAITAAKTAVALRRAEVTAATRHEAEKPLLTVRFAFTAKGRSFPAGEYPVEAAVAAELEDWRLKMEGQATERGWDGPDGYSRESWPPFTLATATT